MKAPRLLPVNQPASEPVISSVGEGKQREIDYAELRNLIFALQPTIAVIAKDDDSVAIDLEPEPVPMSYLRHHVGEGVGAVTEQDVAGGVGRKIVDDGLAEASGLALARPEHENVSRVRHWIPP